MSSRNFYRPGTGLSPVQEAIIAEGTFAERLLWAIGDESTYAFARRIGIGDSTLRRYLDGSMPGVDKLLKLAEGTGVTLDWLAAGRGPMLAAQEQQQSQALSAIDGPGVVLPYYDIRASAGAGALVASEDVSEYFAVGREWLQRSLPPWAPPNAIVGILENGGDSMEPTIRDGDLIVVVQNVPWRVVERGGIFVLSVDERLLLKRLQVRMSGDLSIISDNKAYGEESIRRDDIEHRVIVHGHVFFAGGKPRSF